MAGRKGQSISEGNPHFRAGLKLSSHVATYFEKTVSIGRGRTQGEYLRSRVSCGYLEVAIRVFLLEDYTHCFVDINEKFARLEGHFIYITSKPAQLPELDACKRHHGTDHD